MTLSLPRLLTTLGVLCPFAVCSALAQVPSSSLNGIATDPSHAVVVGAHVTATNPSQGVSRTTLTNGSGLYTLSGLPAGIWNLRVEQTGFAPSEFTNIALQAGKSTTVDVRLRVASSGTTVQVNASGAGTLDMTQSMIQGEVTSRTIQSLPLNGRNFLELAYLIPGNRPAPTFDPTKTNTLEVSSAGGFGRGGNITVDGGDNNDEIVGGTLSNFPEDSVQEFQIATGRFTAEVGRSGNSIINIITKSGTNQYHGSAFFFERNRNLQALPATFDRDLPKPPFDREQMGGSIGGPIRKGRAWWFSSFEYRDQNAAIQTGTRDFTTDTILNTSAPAPLRDALWSSRIDTQITPHNRLMGRYSFNRSTDTAEATPSETTPAFTAAERQNSLNRFNSAIAGLTTVLGSNRVNTLILHFDNFY
ncbi:MAG: carboxypeptidase-like regulatory domain-containing protein, partial [Acidobacteriaceae bacterium]